MQAEPKMQMVPGDKAWAATVTLPSLPTKRADTPPRDIELRRRARASDSVFDVVCKKCQQLGHVCGL